MPADHARGKQVLFLFAHQDDEFFVSNLIRRQIRDGHRLRFLYLTDGSGGKASTGVRDNESRRALRRLGAAHESIRFLGSELAVRDGVLFRQLDRVLESTRQIVSGEDYDEIVCPAWEGGHQDHDATHLIGLALGRHFAAEVWQFSMYNGSGTPRPFFRVFHPIQRRPTDRVDRLSLAEGLAAVSLCLEYSSQKKSWAGLFFQSFVELVILRRAVLQRAAVENTVARPHNGVLLYERRSGCSYAAFADAASRFVATHLKDQ